MIFRMLILFFGIACFCAGHAFAQSHPPGVIKEDPALTALVDATGFQGTVLVYDVKAKQYDAGHAERANLPLIPASTFKVFSTLAALESGVIAGADAVIPWDGMVRSRSELNQDLTLQRAFALSAVPHYQEMVQRIGHLRMQHYIDAVGYGNRDISGGDDSFWLEGNLRISPVQQIDFLKRLYENTLPFRPEVMDTTKAIMVSEQTPQYTLRSKTGLAILPGQHNVGWWIGWVEKGEDVTFFATALEAVDPDASFLATRIATARNALVHLGVLPE